MNSKSLYFIEKMDCPCEERLIRLAFQDKDINDMKFNLQERKLEIYHSKDISEEINEKLYSLNLGAKLLERVDIMSDFDTKIQDSNKELKVLIYVLLINFILFITELIVGFFAGSMGVMADSLDMLADALVYGMSIMAIINPKIKKKNVAKISAYLQMLLALIGIAEVIRRFMGLDIEANFISMIIISSIALIGNAICVYLLQKLSSKEAHIRASLIFSANDVLINIGVIFSAILVSLFNSNYPDLIIGIFIFILVLKGAYRIYSLSK